MGGIGFEHSFDNFDEILWILICCKAIEYELYFIPSEFKFLIIVVEFGVIESDKLDDD